MFALKRLVPAVSLAAMLTLVACTDGTGPGTVDPLVLQSSVTSAMGVFINNAVFQSVTLLGDSSFPQFAAAQLVRSTLPRLAGISGLRPQGALAGAMRIPASPRSNPQQLIPSNILGKTLEWDIATSAYVI